MKILTLLLFVLSGHLFADVIPMPRSIEVKSPPKPLSIKASRSQHPFILKRLAEIPSLRFVSKEEENLRILIDSPLNEIPKFRMAEGYDLEISDTGITIKSKNEFGALQGIETLRQLLDLHDGKLAHLVITDRPRFPWRGLLIDPVRNWLGLETLKKQIDLMALVKLNVLHLHLSDDQAFRVESKLFPKLHSNNRDKKFYSQKEIQELIKYATLKGVRVVPEFDVPGHVSSMIAAYPFLASKKELDKPSEAYGIHDGALNPINEKTYEFLSALFKEMSSLFPDEYFHIGGDEVTGKHWLSNPEISKYMKDHKIKEVAQLQFIFTKRMEGMVKNLGKKMIAWDEVIKEEEPLDALVQVWRGPRPGQMSLKLNMPIIYSYGYYLDLQLSTEDHYLQDPAKDMGLAADPANLWGGEACMWSERTSESTFSNRVWPRAMAVAERLWSPATVRDVNDFYNRQIGLSRVLGIYETDLFKKISIESPRMGVGPEVFGEFLSWLEPGKFYSQHRYRKFTTRTSLQEWVDLMPSESLKATMLNWVVEKWLQKKDDESLKTMERTFNSWIDLSASLKPLEKKKFKDHEALVSLASDLSALGKIALDAIDFIKSGEKPGQHWFKDKRHKLIMMGQVRAGMHPAMHLVVEKLVHQVAFKHSLPY